MLTLTGAYYTAIILIQSKTPKLRQIKLDIIIYNNGRNYNELI
jgi:hypothetical protein